MSRKQIGAFACKVLALYAVIQSINFTQLVIFQFGSALDQPMSTISRFSQIAASLIPILLLASFAGLLWTEADRISQSMFKGISLPSKLKVESSDFQIIGFSIVGVFVLVKVIPVLTGVALNYWLIEKNMQFNQQMTAQTKIRLIISSLEFLLGIGLLFGSRGLAGIISKVRDAGVTSKEIDK